MEDSLYGIESMRRFAGVDLESIPDETRSVKTHNLTQKLFELAAGYLSEWGVILSEGTIIEAPSSTKKKQME